MELDLRIKVGRSSSTTLTLMLALHVDDPQCKQSQRMMDHGEHHVTGGATGSGSKLLSSSEEDEESAFSNSIQVESRIATPGLLRQQAVLPRRRAVPLETIFFCRCFSHPRPFFFLSRFRIPLRFES